MSSNVNINDTVNKNGDVNTTATNEVDSRTARVLKRQRLKIDKLDKEEETELKNSGLLEDGMTKKMKKDLLKALLASRESLKVEKTDSFLSSTSLDHSRNGSESPDLFANDSNSKSDSNASTSKVTTPNSEIELVDKRTYKESGHITMYAPDGINADRYATVIKRSLERYYEHLQEFQKKSLDFVPWGLPVVVGERIKGSLDSIASRKRPRIQPNSETSTMEPKKKVKGLSDSDENGTESSEEEFNLKDKPYVSLKRIWQTTKKHGKKTTQKNLDQIVENGMEVVKMEDGAKNKYSKKVTSDDEAVTTTMKKSSSSDVMCPLCGRMFELNKIEEHASDCGGEGHNSQNGVAVQQHAVFEDEHVILICNSDGDSEQEQEKKVTNGLQHCYFCNMDIPKSIFEDHIKDCTGSSKQKKVVVVSPSSSNLSLTSHKGNSEDQPSNYHSLPNKADISISKPTTGSFYGSLFRSPNSFELPNRSLNSSKKNSYLRKMKY